MFKFLNGYTYVKEKVIFCASKFMQANDKNNLFFLSAEESLFI